MNDFVLGVLLCAITAFLFGSYIPLRKLKSVMQSNIRPEIFNVYFIVGVMLVSLFTFLASLAMGIRAQFTWLGVISGVCLVLVGFFAFLAVPRIGVSKTALIAGPASMLTSIIESVIIGQPIASWWLTVLGFLLVVGGGSAIVLLKPMMTRIRKLAGLEVEMQTIGAYHEDPVAVDAVVDGHLIDAAEEELASLVSSKDDTGTAGVLDRFPGKPKKYVFGDEDLLDFAVGVTCAMLHGAFIATLPLPSLFASERSQGVLYLGSMAVGCFAVIPLSLLMVYVRQGDDTLQFIQTWDNWKVSSCILPGLLSGILWNTGNCFGLYAFQHLEFFLVISFVQCNAIVAEFWGIVFFREVTRALDILVFVLCSFVIVAGCMLLAIGVYQ